MITWQRSHEIEDLFNEEDISWKDIEVELKNAEELHHSLDFYNWDDGVEYPNLLLERKDLDLGTILLLFELIDMDPENPDLDIYDPEYHQAYRDFAEKLIKRHEGKNYPTQISYNGSPGEVLVAEWKRRYSHYEVYPHEK